MPYIHMPLTNRPPTPAPLVRGVTSPTFQTENGENFVYINSSNGYLDREVTRLKEQVNNLTKEVKLLHSILESMQENGAPQPATKVSRLEKINEN